MCTSALIEKLKATHDAIPFDADLADFEFGPSMQNLTRIEHGTPFIVLRFGDGDGIKTSEAITISEELASEAPSDPSITNARLGSDHKELRRVYHEPPVTILEFDEE